MTTKQIILFKRISRAAVVLALIALLALLLTPSSALADGQAGAVTGNKTLAHTDIGCDGSTTVTLTLDGQTGIAGDPADIMLVLDRSNSMSGQPLADLKTAASAFVDEIDEGTDGSLDGVIANGSRIGVVSFATTATLDQVLTASANTVKTAINGLSAGGWTAIGDGINLAQAQLAGGSSNDIMIVFTDGVSNRGADPNTAATNAKNAGTEIFAIGLGNVNAGNLNAWASPDPPQHVYITPNSSDLEAIFEAIGAAIIVPAGTNIQVVDTVDDHFTVSNVSADKGTASAVGNVITWDISELSTETATLSYTVTHDNTKSGGVEQVNDSVTYSDDESKTVTFPNPSLNVHGCAALLVLTPDTAANTVGQSHTVTATVTDDFGDPVSGVLVSFGVVGGLSVVDGEPSAPVPANGTDTTDSNGQASFTYTNSQASADVITATAGLQANVSVELSDSAGKSWEPIEVLIDIKPGSYPNSYGANRRGKIPVALLGSATFDVTTVDDGSVLFGDGPSPLGDAAIAQKSGHFEYVNADSYLDKVYLFWFADTNLDPTDTEGCLGGESNGLDFLGCDSVNIVPR